MNIFVKTKNVPKVLKCKINLNFFLLTNMSFSNRGGGGPDLGKNPTFSRFFLVTSLNKKIKKKSEKDFHPLLEIGKGK